MEDGEEEDGGEEDGGEEDEKENEEEDDKEEEIGRTKPILRAIKTAYKERRC